MRAKLMPTPAQEAALRVRAGQARLVYNLAVEQHSYYVKGGARGPAPGFAEQSRQLTELRAEIKWLDDIPRVVQVQALRDFWRGMSALFDKRSRKPVRRRKWESTFGVVGHGTGLRIDSKRSGAVHVPKLGWVRVRLSRRDYTPALTATSYRIVAEPHGWFVSFVTGHRGREIDNTDASGAVGIDLGVTTTVALSTGQHLRAPHRPSRESRIEALQRKRDAAPRGSEARRRLSRRIARARAVEARRRTDWREKTTTRLVEQYSLIAVEDLRPGNMMRRPKKKQDGDGGFLPNGAAAKAGLNRGLARSGFGAFRARLEAKAAKAKSPCSVVAVSARGTSQTCSRCGHRDKGNRRTQAQFSCIACGFEYHADSNAARNVLARGLSLVPAPAGGQPDPGRRRSGGASGVAA